MHAEEEAGEDKGAAGKVPAQTAVSSPDVGQSAPQHAEDAAQTVQQPAASPGKQAADAVEATQVGADPRVCPSESIPYPRTQTP